MLYKESNHGINIAASSFFNPLPSPHGRGERNGDLLSDAFEELIRKSFGREKIEGLELQP
jgi:hypothetical protein